MKYAAKRTWPDKPKSWEAKGEAETAEAFALEFASDQGLGLGTELVVIEREGEDAEIQFFKIANTSPYQLVQAEPRAGGGGASIQESPRESSAEATGRDVEDGGTELVATPLDSLRPFKTMVLYMLKVAVVAFAAIYALGLLFRYLRSVL
ncbi:hypothetical protein [Thiocapsa bogorovii]|uniref:hypothetical protein n=1 Tax=Thiocapsa bogorovii TaxID=521689 RepID=UPI001E459550|nr:hypothetical protein [Thiocapsa bogorovii]UHD17750.1 hypothetical protein LT988_06785 [Thiocapsa bogorovii]